MTDLARTRTCEELIADVNSTEVLYRQIPKHNWDDRLQRPLSHAFGPADVDKKMSSHSRSSVVSAAASQKWHNEHAAKRSVSVWSYSVQEVLSTRGETEDGTEVMAQIVDDSGCPTEEGEPEKSPGHCYVDYRHLDKPGEKVLRGLLFLRALGRGPVDTKEAQVPVNLLQPVQAHQD